MVHAFHSAVLLHKINLTCVGQLQQQCSVDRLPVFGDTVFKDSPDIDRFQALVPAYTFQCSGRVAEWKACVFPGSGNGDQYYIQFQVWRSTGIEGCYDLVGYNTPLDVDRSQVSDSVVFINGEGFLLHGKDSAPDGCVVLPVRENNQIDFQSGDVIGYYFDYFINGYNLQDLGGIQWIENNQVVIHYRADLPREDIKSQYAIGVNNVCGFPTENTDLHYLSNVASSAPIISLSIGK